MKTSKIFFILFLLLLFRGFSQSQGQKKIDNLWVLYEQTKAIDKKADLLKRIFNIQLYSEPSRAKEIIEELLAISNKEDYTKGVVMANYGKGSYHFIVQEYDSAIHYYKKTAILSRQNNLSENLVDALSGLAAVKGDLGDYYGAIQLNDSLLPLYKEVNNFLSYGVALGNTARFYSNMGQYDRAMQGYINALSVLDTISEEPFRKADVLRDIGRLNQMQKSYVPAIDYLKKALRIYQETDDHLYQSYTLNDMGNTFAAMNQIEEAVTHYQKSLTISEQFNYDNNTANVLANLGSSYRDLGKYDIALKNLLKALEISRSGNSTDNVVSQLAEIGKTYVDRNEISKALSYLNEAIALADSIDTKNYQLSAIGYRAEAYSKKKDYLRAFKDQKSYQSLNDSLFNAAKTKEIEQLKTVYETEQKKRRLPYRKKKSKP